MKGKALKITFNVVLILLMILCVYGVVCRIKKRPLSIGGYQLYVIQSGSMEPALYKYDLTLVKTVDTVILGEGDVITFKRSDGRIVTHRIVEVTDTGFVTRGDANHSDDSPIDASAVYGKNIGKVRYIGAVFMFFQSGFGVALTIIVLVVYCFKDKIGKWLLGEPAETNGSAAQEKTEEAADANETSRQNEHAEANKPTKPNESDNKKET